MDQQVKGKTENMASDHLANVFRETNYHMRCTEQKSLAISGSYIGLLATLLSVTYKETKDFWMPTDSSIYTYIILLLTGCVTYAMQQWYRVWKWHYIAVLKKIAAKWEIEQNLLPCWLRIESRIAVSVDNILPKVVFMTNCVLIFLLCIYIFITPSISSPIVKVGAILFIASMYLVLIYWVHNTITVSRIEGVKPKQ